MAGLFSLALVGEEATKCSLPHIQNGLERVYQAAKRQVIDTIRYSDIVQNDFKKEKVTISWLQLEADKANSRGEDVNLSAVRKLRKDEEDPLIDEAKLLLEDFEKLQKVNGFTFFKCVPNLRMRHRIGRRARKCIENIVKFRDDACKEIIEDETPPGEVTDDSRINSVKSNACELQSRVDVMNDLIDVLKDDSTRFVGVCGPGGTGKTVLIKQVLYEALQKKLLHQRALIQVPKEEGENSIEAQIQELIAKEIFNYTLDNVKELKDRRNRLRESFNVNTEKRVAIILDGLWRGIDLDAIGIPNNGEKVCNVIVIARDMDLLVKDMGLSRDRIFQIKPLELEESMELFLHIVRRSGQIIDEEKISVAQELVKYCGGLPSLTKHQASDLRNHRHISAWRDALREIKSQNTQKMFKTIEETLSTGSSHEHDPNEIRSLFSLCGLLGESSISVEDLTIHCRPLGILSQDVTVKENRDRVKRLLHILRARSLIDGDNNKVKINDLFRELAVLIASHENYLVIRNSSTYTRSELKESAVKQLAGCTALSIDGLNIFEDCPKLGYLKMLQLGSEQHSLEMDDDKFFNRMKELRGLHLKHIDFISSSFPSSVENLENLQTLCLRDCRLKDVKHIGKLKKLQILKISGSDIIELPEDVQSLTDLRLLDLRGCVKLQVIKQGVLRALKGLEELYFDDSFDKWGVPNYWSGSSRRNASLDELNEMTWLSTLHVCVPKSTMFPKNLKLDRLEKYKILLGDVRKYSAESVKVRTLRLDLSHTSNPTYILWEEGVKRIMHKTKSLYLKRIMRMPKPSIHQLCSQGFPYLNELHLEDCDSVEYIVESSESVLAFPKLETLTLVNMKNLRKICNGPLMDESFGQLKEVIVEKCDALNYLFDFSLVEKISALKKIQVKDCKNMAGVVKDDIGQNDGTRKKILWDKLRHLSLENIKRIVGFCITDTTQTSSEIEGPGSISETTAFFDGDMISFPALESLSLIGLPNARKILYQNTPWQELTNLQSLKVEGFEEASQLTSSLFCSPKTTPQPESVPRKPNLGFSCSKAPADYNLQIESPQNLKTSGMENKKENKRIAVQAKILYPEGHPEGNSRYQNLRCVTVCGYETQKFLFTTSMAQGLPQLTELTIASCKMMEEVIKVDDGESKVEFKELTTLCLGSLENLTTFSKGNISVSFPSLESLKISDCPKLTALFTDSEDGEISDSLFNAEVSPSFPSLADLDIRNMNNLTIIWQCQVNGYAISSQNGGESGGSSLFEGSASKLWKTFLNIKKLHIIDCDSLVKILNVKGSLDAEDYDICHDAQLNKVYLKDLDKIEDIWGRNGPKGRIIHYRYLETVSLRRCQRIQSLFPASMTGDLLRLQIIKVKSCNRMKHLMGEETCSSRNVDPLFFFPDVTILKLRELPQLITFYRGPHCSEWPSLEQLTVSKCDNFKIFASEYKKFKASKQALWDSQPLFLVNKNSFCRLSTLELSQNLLMKQILGDLSSVEFQKLKVLKLTSFSIEPVLLPLLFLLKSPHLESLQVHNHHFINKKSLELKGPSPWPMKQLATERSLREMELSKIPIVSDLKEALDSLLGVSSSPFRWLTSLKVSNCHLEYLFTYSMAKSLDCLTRLTIANCESMKVVVTREDGETKDKVVVASEGETTDKDLVASEEGKMKYEVILPKLECLTLDSLQGLTSFCEENYRFKFPFLEEVTIRECFKMKKFTRGDTSSPNLFKFELQGKEINLPAERNLNKIINKVARVTNN